MFEALRLAAYLSRVCSPDTTDWLSAEDVLRAATQTSAAILGFDRIGRLDPGHAADIVFLDLAHIRAAARSFAPTGVRGGTAPRSTAS